MIGFGSSSRMKAGTRCRRFSRVEETPNAAAYGLVRPQLDGIDPSERKGARQSLWVRPGAGKRCSPPFIARVDFHHLAGLGVLQNQPAQRRATRARSDP